MFSAGPSSSKPKCKKKKNKKEDKQKTNANDKGKAPMVGGVKKEGKGKCFNCGEKGHWRSACPQPKKVKNQGISHSLVIETCLAASSAQSWVVDTGATDHVYFNLQGFQLTRELSEDEIIITMGNSSRVAAKAVGDVHLSYSDRILVLRDVLYVPSFRKNLISVSKLFLNGYFIFFGRDVVIYRNDEVICSGTLVNNLYTIDFARTARIST